MDEFLRDRIINYLLADQTIEQYSRAVGKNANKTTCRKLAAELVPQMVDQLDSKINKQTKTAEKLADYVLEVMDMQDLDDPRMQSVLLTQLLGSKKNDTIFFYADRLLVHPSVVEQVLGVLSIFVFRVYGDHFGRPHFKAITSMLYGFLYGMVDQHVHAPVPPVSPLPPVSPVSPVHCPSAAPSPSFHHDVHVSPAHHDVHAHENHNTHHNQTHGSYHAAPAQTRPDSHRPDQHSPGHHVSDNHGYTQHVSDHHGYDHDHHGNSSRPSGNSEHGHYPNNQQSHGPHSGSGRRFGK